MAINTTAIRDLLRPGLAAVFGDYPMYPAQWAEIFEKHTSDKAVEIEVEVKLLGLAQLKAEGASTNYGEMGQRYVTNYVNKYVSTGFIITRQAIKDNLEAAMNSPKQSANRLGPRRANPRHPPQISWICLPAFL